MFVIRLPLSLAGLLELAMDWATVLLLLFPIVLMRLKKRLVLVVSLGGALSSLAVTGGMACGLKLGGGAGKSSAVGEDGLCRPNLLAE